MKIAREILQRYPTLRESWPVQQARAWRQQQEYRQNPRRMASWYRDAEDMHTRICISNLELPEAPHLCQPATVNLSLLDQDGVQVTEKRYKLGRNGSLVLEVAELLPSDRRGKVLSGQVRMDFEGENLGSSRAYLHWYNRQGLTSSHEKFGKTIPAVAGYWTVPSVQHDAGYRTYLAVINLDDTRYSSDVVLKDHAACPLQGTLEVPPSGSRFVSLDDLFVDPSGFLSGKPGTLQFGNNLQPAIYYYFVANDTLGTWRAQHL